MYYLHYTVHYIFFVVAVPSAQVDVITTVLSKYQRVKKDGTLHMVPFTTVFEYMFYLRELSLLLAPVGPRAMVYLAAAVSDFYVHPSNMVQGLT